MPVSPGPSSTLKQEPRHLYPSYAPRTSPFVKMRLDAALSTPRQHIALVALVSLLNLGRHEQAWKFFQGTPLLAPDRSPTISFDKHLNAR